MFNNISLGSIDINIDNLSGLENNKEFKINGKISVGISVNSQVLNKIEPLLEAGLKFESNKLIGKQKVQRELDELELLEIQVRKARLQKQLRDLEK